MSDTMTDALTSRYEAIGNKLSARPLKNNPTLERDVALLGMARLGSLMPIDEGKDIADKANENIGGLLDRINERVADGASSNDSVAGINNLAVYELIALNNKKPIGHSNSTNTAIKTLLLGTDEKTGTLGRLALSRHQDLFDKKETEQMPSLVGFVKGEDTGIADSTLVEIAIIADATLNTAKMNQDSGLIQGSFPNLVNHKVFEELQHRIDNKPLLSSLMFKQFGKSFAPSLYEYAMKTGSDSCAMDLLGNSKHGLMKDSKSNITTDPQVKSLLELVVKSNKSDENIGRLVAMTTTPESLDVMLESLTDVHNNHYSSQNLANIVDKVGSVMSADQLKRFGETLVKNYQYQPVLPALQKIIDAGKEKGYEFGHLDRASSQIRQELNNDFNQLTSPLSAYSTTTIEFPDSNVSIALRDSKSVPHLQLMINEAVGDEAGEFEISGSDSLVDRTTVDALTSYMVDGDAAKLNSLMSSPIRTTEKNSKKRAQLLFEANKQNKTLPPLSLDEINMLSDVVGKDAAIYAGDKHLISLSDLHSSNDIADKLAEHGSKYITVDETGLGKEYDKKLLSTLKDYADDPKNKQKQSDLNELVGLPVTELSSKIENQQENQQSDGSFIKKVTDSLLTTVRSPKQTPRRSQ